MMNLIALSLVVTSLATASLFSPTPKTQYPQNLPESSESTIIKEGHRVVVVEYDEDGFQNTKISISSPQPQQQVNDASFLHAPKDLICDAYGKCKQKIADAVAKTKDKASQTANDASFINSPKDKLADAVGKTKETAREVGDKAKEAVSELGQQNDASFLGTPKDLICDAYGKCKQKLADAVGKTTEKASDTAREAAERTKETAREVGDKAKEAASQLGQQNDASFFHTPNPKDLKQKFAGAMGKTKEKVTETARDIQESAEAERSRRNVTREEAKEAVKNIGSYILSSMGIPSLGSIMNVMNLLGLATAYGLCVWVTFISSYVLSRVIPRQQFGVVQSKVYPVYFRAMTYAIGLALLGHLLSHRNRAFVLQAYNLLLSLIATFINSIYLEPRATKVMFERMKVEKEEGRGREDITVTDPVVTRGTEGREHHSTSDPNNKESATREQDLGMRSRILRLNQKLNLLNSYSSYFNILTLMSLTWHLVYLAQLVHRCS